MAMDRAAQLDPTLIPKFFELGLMGIEVPEAHGGAGGTLAMVVIAVEEISRVDASSAIMVDVQNTLVNYPIVRYGERSAADEVPPAAHREDGRRLRALRARLGLRRLRARDARRAGRTAAWMLTGRKLWITNGAEAGIFVVFANADPAAGYKGITAFIVERGFKGFAVGKKEDKLGIRASSTTELILDGCEVPAANVLGPVGQGYKIAIETLNTGRIGIGAQMIGVARGALDAAIAFVKERKQFGKPVADFQAVQFQLAQAATELEAARLMVYNAARLKDAGRPFTEEAAMAKLFSSQVAERVTSLCLELLGGYGYTKDYPAEKFYRDAKIGDDLRGHVQHAAADDREAAPEMSTGGAGVRRRPSRDRSGPVSAA